MSQITEKIKWAMSLRDPQYEALTFFDNISEKIDYRISSKEEAEKIASENCQIQSCLIQLFPHPGSIARSQSFLLGR